MQPVPGTRPDAVPQRVDVEAEHHVVVEAAQHRAAQRVNQVGQPRLVAARQHGRLQRQLLAGRHRRCRHRARTDARRGIQARTVGQDRHAVAREDRLRHRRQAGGDEGVGGPPVQHLHVRARQDLAHLFRAELPEVQNGRVVRADLTLQGQAEVGRQVRQVAQPDGALGRGQRVRAKGRKPPAQAKVRDHRGERAWIEHAVGCQ